MSKGIDNRVQFTESEMLPNMSVNVVSQNLLDDNSCWPAAEYIRRQRDAWWIVGTNIPSKVYQW